jgi:hypothetical protein
MSEKKDFLFHHTLDTKFIVHGDKNNYPISVPTCTELSVPFLPLSSLERSLDSFSILRVTGFIWCHHQWAVTKIMARLPAAL